MTIPHITEQQAKAMFSNPIDAAETAAIFNKRIDAMNAEAEQSNLITSEQARALGAWNAEVLERDGVWRVCGIRCQYPKGGFWGDFKYRAINQPKPAEPHAELKALYAQQVKDGTLDNFVWEYKNIAMSNEWYAVSCNLGVFHEFNQYRCTPKPTCQVQLIGGEVKTMTREAAKALQAETRDTHDWFDPLGFDWVNPMEFKNAGTYQYRPKAKKVISWSSLPVGVMTNKGEFRGAYVDQQGNCMLDIERVAGSGEIGVAISAQLPANITLAPASEQKWIAVQDDMPPAYEMLQQLFAKGINAMASGERFKVTGIESGYVLGGEV